MVLENLPLASLKGGRPCLTVCILVQYQTTERLSRKQRERKRRFYVRTIVKSRGRVFGVPPSHRLDGVRQRSKDYGVVCSALF